MGVSVRQKIKGKGRPWWVFITHSGKRTSKRIGSFRAAKAFASAVEERLAKGEFSIEETNPAPTVPTFCEYSKKWLAFIESMRRPSTHERYTQVLRDYINPVIGAIPLDGVTKSDVRDLLIKQRGKGLSISSISVFRDVMSGVYHFAIDEEVVGFSPVSGVTRRLGLKRNKIDIEPFTRDEIELILETCEKLVPFCYPVILTLARTGMRLGEVIALEWKDIDWNKKTISVRRSYRRLEIGPTKTETMRFVDMTPHLASVLRSLYIRDKKRTLETGREIKLLFHRNGRIIEQNYIRRQFERVLKKAGIVYRKVHNLRHSYASILLSEGAPLLYVSKQLGHRKVKTTLDVYSHWIPSEGQITSSVLDNTPISTLSAPKNEKSDLSR
jgi:integrase